MTRFSRPLVELINPVSVILNITIRAAGGTRPGTPRCSRQRNKTQLRRCNAGNARLIGRLPESGAKALRVARPRLTVARTVVDARLWFHHRGRRRRQYAGDAGGSSVRGPGADQGRRHPGPSAGRLESCCCRGCAHHCPPRSSSATDLCRKVPCERAAGHQAAIRPRLNGLDKVAEKIRGPGTLDHRNGGLGADGIHCQAITE